MSAEKCDRIHRLRNDKDKTLVITAHRLLYYALQSTYCVQPDAGDWGTGWHGKPYLKNAPHIHCNLSHSGSVAMCALHKSPVGVDVEQIKSIEDGIAQRFMSKEELAMLEKTSDKPGMFYKIWTLKEAYVKYCGRGLGAALSKLTIYPDEERIKSSVRGCEFALIDTLPGYQAAVCASDCSCSIEWVNYGLLDVL